MPSILSFKKKKHHRQQLVMSGSVWASLFQIFRTIPKIMEHWISQLNSFFLLKSYLSKLFTNTLTLRLRPWNIVLWMKCPFWDSLNFLNFQSFHWSFSGYQPHCNQSLPFPELIQKPHLPLSWLPRGCQDPQQLQLGPLGTFGQKVATPKTGNLFGNKKGHSFANCFFFPMYLDGFGMIIHVSNTRSRVLMLQYINPSIETMKQIIWVFVAQGRIRILVLRCTWNHPQRQMIPLAINITPH